MLIHRAITYCTCTFASMFFSLRTSISPFFILIRFLSRSLRANLFEIKSQTVHNSSVPTTGEMSCLYLPKSMPHPFHLMFTDHTLLKLLLSPLPADHTPFDHFSHHNSPSLLHFSGIIFPGTKHHSILSLANHLVHTEVCQRYLHGEEDNYEPHPSSVPHLLRLQELHVFPLAVPYVFVAERRRG